MERAVAVVAFDHDPDLRRGIVELFDEALDRAVPSARLIGGCWSYRRSRAAERPEEPPKPPRSRARPAHLRRMNPYHCPICGARSLEHRCLTAGAEPPVVRCGAYGKRKGAWLEKRKTSPGWSPAKACPDCGANAVAHVCPAASKRA